MLVPHQDLVFTEFFAGEGNVWKMLRADSLNSVGVDIRYSEFMGPEGHGDSPNPFDILTSSGLA